MKKVQLCFAIAAVIAVAFACSKSNRFQNQHTTTSQVNKLNSSTVALPHPDHIIYCWFENKGYSQVIGSANAPYINSLLPKGTLFNSAYAITHPSYPNYVAFFSGSTQGIKNDNCINNVPYSSTNIYTSLTAVSKSFAWYSEGLPKTGSRTCTSGDYVEKHNPTTIFTNVPKLQNKKYLDFPTDYTKLENVVCITPNLINDMHDGTVKQGDDWLKNNCAALIEWCRTHNSIFVVYFDEDDGHSSNRIPVVMVGEHVKSNYTSTLTYDHYNFLRTTLDMFGAACVGSSCSKSAIGDCWN